MDHLRHQKYKNKQLKNSSLELENNFKPINISTNNMDKFEKIKELTKNRTLAKNTWFNWYYQLINYIPESIKKLWLVLNIKIMILFKTQGCSQPKRVKNVYGGGKKPSKLKKSEGNIIKNIRNLFKLKKENKAIKDIKILRPFLKNKKKIITNQ